MKEFAPVPSKIYTPNYSDRAGIEAIEAFRAAPIKIAIQKGGALTEISRKIFSDQLGIEVPNLEKGAKVTAGVTDNPDIGYIYARNKDLTGLVRNNVVDLAIVGSDRVLEEHAEADVEILDIYGDYVWPLVLATRPDSEIEDMGDIRTVATSYPRITREAFRRADNEGVTIFETAGGTELYAYLTYGGQDVDAISDITETGNSLRAHGLDKWDPPLFHVSPTLISPKDSEVIQLFNIQTTGQGAESITVVDFDLLQDTNRENQ